jgi:hypothetical protein
MSPVFKNSFIGVLGFLWHSWDIQFCFMLLSIPFHQHFQTAWPMVHCYPGCSRWFQITHCGLCLLLAAMLISQFISLKWGSRLNDVLRLKPSRMISKINSTVYLERISGGINPLEKWSESLCQLDRDIYWFQKVHHGWSAVWQRVSKFSTLIDTNNHDY